jgi:transcriptional regulator with XRE-family HTH domain
VDDAGMPRRSRHADDGRRWWSRLSLQIGDQLKAARLVRGLTLRELAAAIGSSASEISRRELGKSAKLTGEKLAVHAAAIGLKLSVNLWPVGGGVRDAAQARIVAAFVARVGRAWRVVLEAPIPIAGDLRAVDILLVRGEVRVAIEVITRLADLQAQVRAAQLKARDLGATRLILVVAGTHSNRRALEATRGTLAEAFDLDTRRVMADLARGADPGRDAIVVLTA